MTEQQFANRVAQIEAASPSEVQGMCAALREDALPRVAVDALVTRAVHILIGVLQRRPELRSTDLIALLDSFTSLACRPEHDVQQRASMDIIWQEVRGALPLWLDRLEDDSGDLERRVGALCVLSECAPELPALQVMARQTTERIPMGDELWYSAFDAARKVLDKTVAWPKLLFALREKVDSETPPARVPPFPTADVAVLVASLPYLAMEEQMKLYERLDQADPGDIVEEARYLPHETRIEPLTRAVQRINRAAEEPHPFFLDLYQLLRAIFNYGAAEPDYIAHTGSTRFMSLGPPPPPPKLNEATLRGLTAVLECKYLWASETNLLEIFGLPKSREGFLAWLSSARELETKDGKTGDGGDVPHQS